MPALVIGFLVSLIPSLLYYFWFKKFREDPLYKETCKNAFWKGVFAILPILGLSFVFNLVSKLLPFEKGTIPYDLFHTFIVLALAEELVKYYMGVKVIKEAKHDISHLDIIVIMGIVGIAFGLAEDIPYAIGANVPTMIVRGVTMGHGIYGMTMGYLYGKHIKKGGKAPIISIIIPWLFHGAYDFGLSQSFMDLGEYSAFLSVSIALLEFIFLFVYIFFIRKARKKEKYTAVIIKKTVEEPIEQQH